MSLNELPKTYVTKSSGDSRAKKTSNARSAAKNIIVGVTAFLFIALTIAEAHRAIFGIPYIAVLSEKRKDFQTISPDVDMVFLGSSTTFRHVDPETVSRRLSIAGHDLMIYNFGVPALSYPELVYLVDIISNAESDGLKYVVIQDPLPARGDLDSLLTDRGRYFRYGPRLSHTVSDIICYTGTKGGLLRRLYANILSIGAEQIGFGRLSNILFPSFSQQELTYDPAYRTNNGFWPVDLDFSAHVVARNLKAPMTHDKMAYFLKEMHGEYDFKDSVTCRAKLLLGLIETLESAGYTVVFFRPPIVKTGNIDSAIVEEISTERPDLAMLDFDPEEYALFAEPDLWFDETHMRDNGAQILSGMIANELSLILGTNAP